MSALIHPKTITVDGLSVRYAEGVYAFRPRAHQDRIGTVLAALGVADRQSVNRDCLRVNQSAHGQTLSGPATTLTGSG